jgi:hypothetical protein
MTSLLGCSHGFAFVGCLKVVIGLVDSKERSFLLLGKPALCFPYLSLDNYHYTARTNKTKRWEQPSQMASSP